MRRRRRVTAQGKKHKQTCTKPRLSEMLVKQKENTHKPKKQNPNDKTERIGAENNDQVVLLGYRILKQHRKPLGRENERKNRAFEKQELKKFYTELKGTTLKWLPKRFPHQENTTSKPRNPAI